MMESKNPDWGVTSGRQMFSPKCAAGARKEEWGADGEMKGPEDGLTAPEGSSGGRRTKKRSE